jgi:hypothetical protein
MRQSPTAPPPHADVETQEGIPYNVPSRGFAGAGMTNTGMQPTFVGDDGDVTASPAAATTSGPKWESRAYGGVVTPNATREVDMTSLGRAAPGFSQAYGGVAPPHARRTMKADGWNPSSAFVFPAVSRPQDDPPTYSES